MLISLYYSTRDLDLLVSLSVLLNVIDSFSREPGLSAKCILKFVVECMFLCNGGCCRYQSVIQLFSRSASYATIVNCFMPHVVMS